MELKFKSEIRKNDCHASKSIAMHTTFIWHSFPDSYTYGQFQTVWSIVSDAVITQKYCKCIIINYINAASKQEMRLLLILSEHAEGTRRKWYIKIPPKCGIFVHAFSIHSDRGAYFIQVLATFTEPSNAFLKYFDYKCFAQDQFVFFKTYLKTSKAT